MEDFEQGLGFGIVAMTVAVILSLTLVFYGDNNDSINVRDLGIKLCNEKGFDYNYRECNNFSQSLVGCVPIIHCKNRQNITYLIDDIVVKD